MTRPHLGHPDDQHDVLYWGTYDGHRAWYQQPYEYLNEPRSALWRSRCQYAFKGLTPSQHLSGYIDGFSAWSWGSWADPDILVIQGYVPLAIALRRFAEVFPGIKVPPEVYNGPR